MSESIRETVERVNRTRSGELTPAGLAGHVCRERGNDDGLGELLEVCEDVLADPATADATTDTTTRDGGVA